MDVIPTISAAKPSASRDFYLAYLNSPAWRMTRSRALKLAGYRCSRCPSKRDLQVHHKTYDRLGAERDSDLEVLCENCHRGEHLDHSEQTSLGVYLSLASAEVRENPFSSIADLAENVKQRCVELKIKLNYERIESALAVVCGNRLKTKAPAPAEEVACSYDRPITHQEARECLLRLGVESLVKQIPAAAPSRIDIYGPVPREDWVEHDRY